MKFKSKDLVISIDNADEDHIAIFCVFASCRKVSDCPDASECPGPSWCPEITCVVTECRKTRADQRFAKSDAAAIEELREALKEALAKLG